jgi:peroxiredoxin
VLHLFCKVPPATDAERAMGALKGAAEAGQQVVSVALAGHKADACFMLLGPDLVALRRAQSELTAAGLQLTASFLSLTEVSEYARGLPSARLKARLHPKLPPQGKRAFCFYPMSKRRQPDANWYRLPYEERLRLMYEHGASGRRFAGRVLQLVTGSTGLDDFEWGVTLFAKTPDDLKECVHTMRFDEVSALYADFGPFYTGVVGPAEEVLALCGAL